MKKRLTPAERLDRMVPEDTVLKNLMQLAKLQRLPHVHFKTAQIVKGVHVTPFDGDAGWPDLVVVKGDTLYLLECKKELPKPSAEQERWIEALGNCERVEVGVVRPSSLDSWLQKLAS